MVRTAPASWVIAVVVAFCAVLLLKWLALVAVAAVVLFVFVRWARGGWDGDGAAVDPAAEQVGDGQVGVGQVGDGRPAPARSHRLPYTVDDVEVPTPRPSAHDDCTWCGLRGGHRDDRGRLVRPRHAHAVPG